MHFDLVETPVSQRLHVRSRAVRWCVVSAVASAGLLMSTSDAFAQTSVRFLPSIGIHMPPSDDRDAGSPSGILSSSRSSGAFAWGLAVEVGPPQSGTSLRGQVGRASTSRMPLPGFECADCSTRSSVRTASLAAVFRPIPRLALVQPQFVTGVGVSTFEYRTDGPGGDGSDTSSGTSTSEDRRISGQLGVGLEASVLGLRTQWELNAFVTPRRPDATRESAGGFATDLYLTLAIPIGG
jgi:hypothetical protein